jgi:hypothetical protein
MSEHRKSRRRRLPISGALGAPPKWTRDDGDWTRFETAYGGALFDAEMRTEIAAAVGKYFYWAGYEAVAPFATGDDGAIEKLKRASRLAEELYKAVKSLGDAQHILAPHWGKYFPGQEIADDELPAGLSVAELFDAIAASPPRRYRRDLPEMVHVIASSIGDTLRDVDRPDAPAFEEGEAWGLLVRDLEHIFEARTLSIAAAKGNEANPEPSPFVRFIREIQNSFPADLKRHSSSYDALAKAISVMRRKKEP